MPDTAKAFLLQGKSLAEKGNYEQAIEEYNQAINIDPKYAVAFNNRGNAYRNLGKYDLAIADFNEAIRLDPKRDGFYDNRGNTFKDMGDHERANKDYAQVRRLKKILKSLISVGDTVPRICDIYAKHGTEASQNMTPNRAEVNKHGFLVHALRLDGNHDPDNRQRARKNEFPLIGWPPPKPPDTHPFVINEFPNAETFIMTIPGRDPTRPCIDPYPIQALWVKLTSVQIYTFMGLFKRTPKSTEAKVIYDRCNDKYYPADHPDMKIIGFV
jgi:tetratricopeptide (TPR) repeat protein